MFLFRYEHRNLFVLIAPAIRASGNCCHQLKLDFMSSLQVGLHFAPQFIIQFAIILINGYFSKFLSQFIFSY